LVKGWRKGEILFEVFGVAKTKREKWYSESKKPVIAFHVEHFSHFLLWLVCYIIQTGKLKISVCLKAENGNSILIMYTAHAISTGCV